MTSAADLTATGTFPGWSPGFQAALARLAIAARRPAGSPYPGAVRSNALGRAIEFADYRPYVAGDEPRLIDWRVYGRLDRLYVKRHLEERERTLTLLIDASASLDFGDGEAHKGRYARRLAAALAWISLARHEPVHAFLLRDSTAERLAPALSLGDIPRLFGALGAVREQGATHLGASVRAALSRRPRGPVVLISDLLDEHWREGVAALAAHEAVILQPLAPGEWDPALGEEVELEDAETGERISVRLGPSEVAAYCERLEALISEIAGEARRRDVLHVPLHSDETLADSVLRTLLRAGVVAA